MHILSSSIHLINDNSKINLKIHENNASSTLIPFDMSNNTIISPQMEINLLINNKILK